VKWSICSSIAISHSKFVKEQKTINGVSWQLYFGNISPAKENSIYLQINSVYGRVPAVLS